MAVSVQLVSRAASEKLSIKYSDLSDKPESPDGKRLSLQVFLLSNYASSPRRRFPTEESRGSSSPSAYVLQSQRRSAEMSTNLNNGDTSMNCKFGSVVLTRNSSVMPGLKKTTSGTSRSTTFKTLSLKYKILYLCGISNIDMVDNYVMVPR